MSSPQTMRAVSIHNGKGPVSALHITDVPKPQATGSGDAIVKVKAFGLNRMDLLQREGNYPVPPGASQTLGVEFSGTIESEAKDAERGFKVGDEVFGLAYGGAYAEYIAVSTHMLIHKPKNLSWEDAAGIPEVWITALQALYLIGEFSPGKSILWHAGASSVSIAGIQLSTSGGASATYATVGTPAKASFLTDTLGCTQALNYRTQNWAQEILSLTSGKGVDIVIDFVGASHFQGNLDVAARDGRIVHLGMLSGTKLPEGTDIAAFVMKRVRFEGSSLRSRDVAYQRKLRDKVVEIVLPGIEKGELKHFTEKVFPWEEIQEAHNLMEANKTMGKIICTIG